MWGPSQERDGPHDRVTPSFQSIRTRNAKGEIGQKHRKKSPRPLSTYKRPSSGWRINPTCLRFATSLPIVYWSSGVAASFRPPPPTAPGRRYQPQSRWPQLLTSPVQAIAGHRLRISPRHFRVSRFTFSPRRARRARREEGANESNEGRDRSSKLPNWSWTACSRCTVHWSPPCWIRHIGLLVNGDLPGINDGVKRMVNRL